MNVSVICNKQPILNAQHKLHSNAYSLQPTSSQTYTDEQWQAITESLFLTDTDYIQQMTGDHLCFYRAPKCMLDLARLPPVADPQKLVIEVSMDAIHDKALLLKLKEIKTNGIKIALNDYKPNSDGDKLLSICHFAKVDPEIYSDEALTAIAQRLKNQSVLSIVTKVTSEIDFLHYKDLGFELFQGHYFTNPVIHDGQELRSNELSLLRLMADINDDNVEFEHLANIIATDVALAHKLLTAINHPNNGLPHHVNDLKEAVTFMGLNQLKFFASMMLMARVENVPSELMVTALVRGKFMEYLASVSNSEGQKDAFFMAGLFSTLSAFFKVPMVDIVNELPLSQDLQDALLNQSGAMGKGIYLIRSLEQGNTHMIAIDYEGCDIMEISTHYMQANGWARATINAL